MQASPQVLGCDGNVSLSEMPKSIQTVELCSKLHFFQLHTAKMHTQRKCQQQLCHLRTGQKHAPVWPELALTSKS